MQVGLRLPQKGPVANQKMDSDYSGSWWRLVYSNKRNTPIWPSRYEGSSLPSTTKTKGVQKSKSPETAFLVADWPSHFRKSR